jgi:molybdopterin-containing oxidoreductase family iron-sulfur binding subunit
MAAAAATMSGCGADGPFESFFRRHYRRLDAGDKARLFERLERETLARTGVRVSIGDPPPLAGVVFAFALDLDACNGNRRCVEACARENNLPSDPELRYIRLLASPRGSGALAEPDAYYQGSVPVEGQRYLPVQCQQCARPPCVEVCPCKATWQEPDGIVVVDYEWCIGCRYCQAACPYHARRFNFAPPSVAPDRIQPAQGYLSNRLRPVGVVEKCTFCLQRVRRGLYPACVEACPTGARKFGDLNDPTSEVRLVLARKSVWVLKEQLGTVPRFFYFAS